MKVPAIINANRPEVLLPYAQHIAVALVEKHFPELAGKFVPYGDVAGVLEQIDNITCGLVRPKRARIDPCSSVRSVVKNQRPEPYG